MTNATDETGATEETGVAEETMEPPAPTPAAIVVRGTRLQAGLRFAAAVVASAAVITVLTVETGRRFMFLVVPFGALLGWSASRLQSRLTVGRAIAVAAAVVVVAAIADYASAVWGFVRIGVPAATALRHLGGVTRFLSDNVWSVTDGLLVLAAATVAAALSWPRSAVPASPRAASGD
jgi:hypothetical protein